MNDMIELVLQKLLVQDFQLGLATKIWTFWGDF